MRDPGEEDEPLATTADNGFYFFDNLDADTYAVREVVQEHWEQTYPPDLKHMVDVDPPNGDRVHGEFGVAETPNFGNWIPDISGYKWDDQDRDSVWDDGELGLSGWEIYLDLNDNGELDFTDDNGNGMRDPGEEDEPLSVTVTRQTTDGPREGFFAFDGLSDGPYTVREVVQENWEQAYPGLPNFEHEVTIDPANGVRVHGEFGVAEEPNFGNYPEVADVSVIKEVDEPHPSEHQQIVYTITVHNAGPDTATNVIVMDNLPDGVTFKSAEPSEGRYDPENDKWLDVELDAAETQTLTITAIVNAGTAGTVLTNTAMISAPQRDPDNDNNKDTVTATVRQTVQFITPLSLFRPVGPFARPAGERLAIAGFVWDDSNDDGIWQVEEPGVNGVVVYVDLDGNGVRDVGEPAFPTTNDGSRDGGYWFEEIQFVGALPGTSSLRVDLPSGVPSFPENGQHDVMLGERDQVFGIFQRPHITSEVGGVPNFGLPSDAFDGTETISGYKWHDVDQNGVWDAEEQPMPGWLMFIDLPDSDTENKFDPDEPFAVTDGSGQYVFRGLFPGDYTIREDRLFGISEGTFQIQEFPAADEHLVTVETGSSVHGNPGIAEVPNFGTFDYSPFIRPADDHFGHLDVNHDGVVDEMESDPFQRRDKRDYLGALDGWQSFTVTNDSGRPFDVVDITKHIDTSLIDRADEFVAVLQKQTDENGMRLVPVPDSPRIPVPAVDSLDNDNDGMIDEPDERSVQFYVFYDPAIRDENGNVQEGLQYPDWFGDSQAENPAHTFARSDHLEVITQFDDDAVSAGPKFVVDLVGGASFDSDVFYDGAVDLGDLRLIDDMLLKQWPIVENVEVQRIRIKGDELTGTFSLTFGDETTTSLPLDATASDVESVLEALPSITDVAVNEAGGPGDFGWKVTFVDPDGIDLSVLTIDANDIGGTITLAEVTRALFDPSADLNARFLNGTEPWPELGLGDFGPLNVEFLRARAPLLDLDPDNSSGALGVDYHVELSSGAVKLVDTDGRFANSVSKEINELQSMDSSMGDLSIRIDSPADGAVIRLSDAQLLPPSLDYQPKDELGPELTISAIPGTIATVADFNQVLPLIELAAGDESGVIDVEFVARGVAQEPNCTIELPVLECGAFTRFVDDRELIGRAFTKVLIIPS
jgi:uncharacterized repeat protein (TIGR01451 family)